MTLFDQLPDAATERILYGIVKRERLSRDTADWDSLRAAYWPDSVVRVTWFEGTAEAFTTVSREQFESGRGRGMHLINPVRSAQVGSRAIVESQGQIHIRARLHGVPCDLVNYCRFFSRAEERDGTWKLLTFDGIYGKDHVETVVPGEALELDSTLLAEGRESYRYLDYLNRAVGYLGDQNLPGDDRLDLVEHFYADAAAWLEGTR